MPLLRDLLKLDILKDAKVLSGESNLTNNVGSVSVLEVYEKLPFIRKEELLISSLSGIKDNIEEQKKTLKMLKDINVSGLIICHLGYVIKNISKELVDYANVINFPLIVSNPNLPYIDIIAPILDNILYDKNIELEETIKIIESFDSTTISNHNPKDIIITLCNIIHAEACYMDSNNILTTSLDNYNRKELYDLYNNSLSELLNNRDCYRTGTFNKNYILTPIINNGKYFGALILENNDNSCNRSYWTAIKKAKSSLVTLSLYAINKKDYLDRLRNDFVIEFLTRMSVNPKLDAERAANLGLSIAFPCVVMVMDLFNFNSVVSKNSESYIQSIKSNIVSDLKLYLSGKKYILTYYSDKFILIYMEKDILNNPGNMDDLIKMGHYFQDMILKKYEFKMTIGIGNKCTKIQEIKSSYDQAMISIKTSNKLFKEPKVSAYKDTKHFSVILNSLDEQSSSIIKEILLPLIKYDKNNNTELVKTLKALIQNDDNTATTASKLFIHKNTVIQRRNKIIEILKFNPLVFPYRLIMEMALFINVQS